MSAKKINDQLSLLSVEPEPIPGTHLYRRFEDGREVCPEYQGDAANELIVIEETKKTGYRNVKFGDLHFVQLSGEL